MGKYPKTMPYRKSYRRKNPRTTRKRRSKYKKTYKKTGRKQSGYPQTMFVKLRYVETITAAPAAPYDKHEFSGNSVYDPNHTGGGHQPLYYDQYSAIYSTYKVLASKIKVQMVNRSGSGSIQWIVYPSVGIDTVVNVSEALEQPMAQGSNFLGVGQIMGGYGNMTKKYATTRRVCGASKAQISDESYSAAINTNPANRWYWNILAETVDAATNITYAATVTMTYYVKFYNRKTASQS
nr:MAG: putative capsid protein [Arizlama virus]